MRKGITRHDFGVIGLLLDLHREGRKLDEDCRQAVASQDLATIEALNQRSREWSAKQAALMRLIELDEAMENPKSNREKRLCNIRALVADGKNLSQSVEITASTFKVSPRTVWRDIESTDICAKSVSDKS
jgi:hypothetical protein